MTAIESPLDQHRSHFHVSLNDYLDLLPQPALIQNLDNSITYANPTFLSLCTLPYQTKTLNGLSFDKLVTESDSAAAVSWIKDTLSGTSLPKKTLVTGLAKGGTHLRIEWSAVFVKQAAIILTGTVLSTIPTGEEIILLPEKDNKVEVVEYGKSFLRLASENEITEFLNWRNIPKYVHSLTGGGVMGEMLRGYDWGSTSLGVISSWPQSLLTAVALCLQSSFPMAIWWGTEFVLIYNDGYSAVAGGKHPWLFGKSGAEGWNELWSTLEPLAQNVMRGESCYSEDFLLFMIRNGYLEETYHTWSYIPIRQEDGSVGGLLNPSIESTGRVIAERRLRTLRDLSSKTGMAKTTDELCTLVMNSMLTNPYDIPFALLYICRTEHSDKNKDIVKIIKLTLKGSCGIPNGHPSAPKEKTLTVTELNDYEDTIWPFYKLCQDPHVIEIEDVDELVKGIPIRGWDDPVRKIAACPILTSSQDDPLGVLILGLNPRAPFNEDYKTFVELVCRQIATSIVTVKSYEEEFERAENLAALDRSKTNFFSSVSHELRTPLTLILGPIEDALADESRPLHDVHRERLNLVYGNSRRLLRLVNSLLEFSRIEGGRKQAIYRETNLSKYTTDLASVFRSAIEKGGVKYVVDCGELERFVWVDRDMWEKIVFNMIGNAFKYTFTGTVTVSLRPTPENSAVVFSVCDTGTGIPSHELPRVFERFHRVEGQKGRSHEGTGIGLSLTYELVMLHKGKMEVESEFGKGSTFSVTIPYGFSHLPQNQLGDSTGDFDIFVDQSSRSYGSAMVDEANRWISYEEDNERSDTSSNESSVPSGSFPLSSRGCRVLLADDNTDMRRYVKTLLSKWWQVTEVSDGRQALEEAMKNPPDLIVSDIMMPILDGFELVKVLRSQPETKQIPIILLSARAGEEARVDGLTIGADDYLVKPFNAKELIARVHTHLELGKMRIELESRVREQTRELAESELRYKMLTILSPVGIFRLDTKGDIVFTNDRWWNITGQERAKVPTTSSFLDRVHPDDLEHTSEIWFKALANFEPCNAEFRLKPRPNDNVERWCVAEIIVEYDENKQACGFVGALTDLTELKKLERERLEALALAEQQQRRRAEEAEAIKKQQELFIDMTCHEMRNPLNGIYHNADLLHSSLERVQKEVSGLQNVMVEEEKKEKERVLRLKNVTEWIEVEITHDIEAVETINLCARHQKRIADDVLNMSKLSMDLLVIDQVDFHVQTEIGNVLRMFETEVQSKKIDLKLEIGDGFIKRKVNWVRGDPIRLAQVLINFLTNAIRFTEKAPVRRLIVTLDALNYTPPEYGSTYNYYDKPNDDQTGIKNAASSFQSPKDHTLTNNSALSSPTSESNPNSILLQVSISDSGVGMTSEEQTLLFRRFTQASPKTYAEFGGSGLGLFISKRLVELHGGAVTVESVKDKGTTFKFYIKCDRVEVKEDFKSAPNQTTDELNKSMHKEKVGYLELSNMKAKEERGYLPVTNIIGTEGHIKSESRREDAMNVLIVEDNMVNQKVLRRQLETLGCNVTVANHGLEALQILEMSASAPSPLQNAILYDVILMDIEMPVMDGLEATRTIRERENNGQLNGRVPIIAVTGNARKEQLERALETGMDNFIVKPYLKIDLIEKLEQYVRKR